MTFGVEPLADEHHLDTFECGNGDLDDWLRLYSRHATAQGSRTYLLIDNDTAQIVGYFAIAPHLVERDDVPAKVGRGAPRRIPAILLAKLALDRTHQGQGFGTELLVRALGTMVAAARSAGGKVAVVDAIDDGAARFYRHHGFLPLPHNPHRLVLRFSTIAKILRQPWP
ncbi:MAG: GNAT family N-acetyltransferase [Actinobacteria bacterium]|nr:GNAT family N-acetyltransferase [Actinomycetota bacterium]